VLELSQLRWIKITVHKPPACQDGLAWQPIIRQGIAAVLIACAVHVPSTWAEQALPEAANLETAKSDVLQLDRELSRMEQKLLFPNRSLVLFGMSPTLEAKRLTIKLSINGRLVATQQLAQIQLDSLRQGGKLELWADNLRRGNHQLMIELQTDTTTVLLQEKINLNKRQNRNVVGIQWVEPNRVNPSQFRWVEWPDYD